MSDTTPKQQGPLHIYTQEELLRMYEEGMREERRMERLEANRGVDPDEEAMKGIVTFDVITHFLFGG